MVTDLEEFLKDIKKNAEKLIEDTEAVSKKLKLEESKNETRTCNR